MLTPQEVQRRQTSMLVFDDKAALPHARVSQAADSPAPVGHLGSTIFSISGGRERFVL